MIEFLLHFMMVDLGMERPTTIDNVTMQPTLKMKEVYFFHYYRQYGLFGPPEWAPLPRRGDIVLFRNIDGTLRVKRVIGMPNDTVQMIDGRLHINGEQLQRWRLLKYDEADSLGNVQTVIQYREMLPNGVNYLIQEISDEGPLDNTQVFTVPDGEYFVMGDNRDRSQDSRLPHYVSSVNTDTLVGILTNFHPAQYGD